MRGKPTAVSNDAETGRITPAGAGKTNIIECYLFLKRDHPRRCGENRKLRLYIVKKGGSPPQVRGKLPVDLNEIAQQRITPAGAGKTISVSPFAPAATDHPRRCGENPRSKLYIINFQGSPPQVRGKRPLAAVAVGTARITPAGAGKTAAVRE